MKVLILGAALAMSLAGETTTWQIDPAHSAASFAVRHMGISTVRGSFTKTAGTVKYDPSDPKNDAVDVTIDAASVDTRVDMRDNDLRSDHFFDVQKFPTITFKSTKVEAAGTDKLKVTGDLTIHGVTKSVTLAVEGPTKPVDMHGKQHAGVTATTTVDRRDFGMTGYQGPVGNDIQITIDAELVH